MTVSRGILLFAGPFVLVTLSYWVATPGAAFESAMTPLLDPIHKLRTRFSSVDPAASLEQACQQTAASLGPRLSPECNIIIRAPFVIAGDLSEADLDSSYRGTIEPTARALATCYFDTPPDGPITILMFADEESYREHAERFDGRSPTAYFGYYERPDRRVMLNIATGNGTLAHELTHTLAHFDFPSMPEWFDEGLASLHEESRFSDDGLQLQGAPNWRLQYLLEAARGNRLRPLDELIALDGLRTDYQAVDYAHARYLCLYLQDRNLLSHYYRKLRTNSRHDHTGAATLVGLLGVESMDEIDTDFRRWVLELDTRK